MGNKNLSANKKGKLQEADFDNIKSKYTYIKTNFG